MPPSATTGGVVAGYQYGEAGHLRFRQGAVADLPEITTSVRRMTFWLMVGAMWVSCVAEDTTRSTL
jgi:hypothetical protein